MRGLSWPPRGGGQARRGSATSWPLGFAHILFAGYPLPVRSVKVASGAACVLMLGACGTAGSAQVEVGEALYDKVCASCHPGAGPDLKGVVGRPIGSVEAYNYSEALKNSRDRWTSERLTAYLMGPQKMFPNGVMMIKPLGRNEADAVVSYLETM